MPVPTLAARISTYGPGPTLARPIVFSPFTDTNLTPGLSPEHQTKIHLRKFFWSYSPCPALLQFWDCPDGTVGGNGWEEVMSVRTMSGFHSDFALGTCLLALMVPPEALWSLATNVEAIKCHPQDRDEKALFGFPWDGHFFLPWSCSRT